MKTLTGIAAAASLAALLVPLSGLAQTSPATTAGTSAGETQQWTYNEINGYNGLQRATIVREVTTVGAETRVLTRTAEGRVLDQSLYVGNTFVDGALSDRAFGRVAPALDLRPATLEQGQRWSQTVRRDDPIWKQSRPVRVDGVVRGWETVRVPAGEFKVIKIERRMYLGDWDPFRQQTERAEEEWFSPELGMVVKIQVREFYREGRRVFGILPGDWFVRELASLPARANPNN
jgi:hypothetical protein